ncbi:MAG: YafY family transcriptional regulator [Candidimonas sp.]|nr:MAG: YafY family transcriptional regulator [Candidimonas sp.]TAM20788.1 MAG: YafY family transcriptional regulator [Candidimonas sp.]TAM80463.1 MAG: YafY family transcriptional regulator [Candidimonas sp.]
MSRPERLLELLQLLRRHRLPISGKKLADDLGISVRTLYRDIASLQAQGAMIEGERGMGYILQPGFMLPPLMFSDDEIEALVLGSRWVSKRADQQLASAASNALAKIAAVLPKDLRDNMDNNALFIGPNDAARPEDIDLGLVRKAIRTRHKLSITYSDQEGVESRRTIWPIAIGFFETSRLLVSWCELRDDFRHFRTDRISCLTWPGLHYPRSKQALLKEWRKTQGIPAT